MREGPQGQAESVGTQAQGGRGRGVEGMAAQGSVFMVHGSRFGVHGSRFTICS